MNLFLYFVHVILLKKWFHMRISRIKQLHDINRQKKNHILYEAIEACLLVVVPHRSGIVNSSQYLDHKNSQV